MLEEIFNNFKKEKSVEIELYEKYRELLPNELIEIWEKYGLGMLMNGYLKIINPDEYRTIIDMSYFRANVSIPIFATAFGDTINWEENRYIRMVKYKNGTFKGISSGFDFFWEDVITDYFCKEFFELENYDKAVSILGELAFDECFGYVPLLALGGSEKVENLRKVKIREHIELITQLVGGIGY